ncbi:Sulfotransferase family protein [Thermomonospora echinospora]|uniref:Sulfotransferase family protein n=1 Tax=Thermomonospora echinospora TaxID=1992 RepID=A0A1H6E1Y1_9ACTN|nr:sulfotransferase [Thermomonospora echinospora]SEG91620.1 Sulfotransferase family protein [Thermomonospora echinospora]
MTLWRPPQRTPQAEAIYAAAEADRATRPHAYALDPGPIIARALRDTDPAELGDPVHWREGLERYLASAHDDGRLNAVGTRMVRDSAVAALRARLAMNRLAHTNRPLGQPPIIITGGWRTGTTFLYRLLATDPRLRAPLPAELAVPWKFAGASPQRREELIRVGSAANDLLNLLNPALATVHDHSPRLPEECVVAMNSGFRNWGFSATVRLDCYSHWLADQDLTGTYLSYRHVLATLAADSRRWLLKAPAHTAEPPSLAAAFPGACVIFLHRDIVQTIASGASLFCVFRSTYSDHVDPADVGRFQTDQTELWLRRAHAFRRTPQAGAITILDIAYDDLVHDTPAVLHRIYTAAGLTPGDSTSMIDRYHAAHPRNAQGTHHYAAADFALDEADLRTRLAPWTRPGP